MNQGADRPFAALLPDIYRQDATLDALLKAFEKCHLDIEALIEKMPGRLYSAGQTPEDFLDFLGAMTGLRNDHARFTPQQMRALLPKAFWLHRWKGTRIALEFLLFQYLRTLCGKPVGFWIAETEGTMDKEAQVTVYIAHTPVLEKAQERRRLEAIVRDYTPLTVQCRVEYDAQMALGYTYLGYTSYL